MIGRTIGHYKIESKLGEGGMGVVYKAQDTKLDRLVALKFLPEHLHASAEEKARFLQEAKAAATLNHPNVCVIYDVREDEGKNFIVMEFVEGATLREKFLEAPIPVKEALTYATQIGDALEEAHSKGIVHRDIKSDNIMVNKKNQVKVMDFGLAKLKGSLKLTKATSTVGTLGYMAPEQIQGGESDMRADIFSFGAVLFEMLTRRLPFRGEHEAALMYSILHEEPESLKKYIPDAAPELLHILQTSLEKDQNDRYQSAAEMTRELRRLLKQSSRVSRPSASSANNAIPAGTLVTPPKAALSRRGLWIGVGIGVLVIGTAAVILLTKSQNGGSTATSSLNPNMTFRVLAMPLTQVSYPGISADGNWVAFPAADANNKWDIYYMHVSGSETRRITTDSSVNGSNLSADISPDGSQVAYSSSDLKSDQLKISVVSAVGGPSKKIIDDALLPRWRPDGKRIGFMRMFNPSPKARYNFWSANPDGSDARLEFADTISTGGRWSFCWSPDGRSVGWLRSSKDENQEVFIHDLATGAERQLTFDRRNIDDIAWTKSGQIIYSSNRSGNTNLWMIPVAGGPAEQVTKGSGPDIGIGLSADNTRLIYLQQQQVGHVWIADLVDGISRQVTFDDRGIVDASLSPDGKTVAFSMKDIDPIKPRSFVYLQNLGDGNRRHLTSGESGSIWPRWSPDGKWIAFSQGSVEEPDLARLFIIEAENPGVPKNVGTGFTAFWVSPTKFVARREGAAFDEVHTVDGAAAEKFYEDSTRAISLVEGNQIFYLDQRKKSSGYWLLPLDAITNPSKGKPRKLPDFPKGTLVLSSSLRHLYYSTLSGGLFRMNYKTGKQERVRGSFPGLDANSAANVSADDKSVTFVAVRLTGRLVMIENIFR